MMRANDNDDNDDLQVPLGPLIPEPVPEGPSILNPQHRGGECSRQRGRMVFSLLWWRR